ncbi:uncharacterized protein TNCT_524001 [Trichonephila clavata]|uniref:Uncharacterized protein n=1 Tax=Trichonephila clavata TaxID=2740835 RepID=A0A8X6LIN4_TRICU|nr:uncharacterized protein TNCT_524001 [Trichonephila clavata]
MKVDEKTPLLKKELVTVFRRPEVSSPVPEKSREQTNEGRLQRDEDAADPHPAQESEDLLKSIDLASAITSYEAFQSTTCPCTSCGVCLYAVYIWIKHFFFSFVSHLPLFIVLFPWSIFMMYAGMAYLNRCPMNQALPYAILAAGMSAFVSLALRIILLVYMKFSLLVHSIPGMRRAIKVVECIFYFFFILHVVCHYSHERSFDSSDPNYCVSRLYNYSANICVVNIVLVCFKVLVCFCKKRLCVSGC